MLSWRSIDDPACADGPTSQRGAFRTMAASEAMLRSMGMLPTEAEAAASAQRLASSGDVYEALAKRYQICNTVINIFGSQAQRNAGAAVQAARCAARDAVRDSPDGVRDAATLPLLEALRVALASPDAATEDEAARVGADMAFLRGDQDAPSEKETWLAALLYSARYLAASHKPAAEAMLPRIAAVSGRAAAELLFDQAARRWTVREPGGGEITAPVPVPAKLRCARPGCTARGAKVCTACKVVRYCGLECSTAHWKLKPGGHKAACKAACAAKA